MSRARGDEDRRDHGADGGMALTVPCPSPNHGHETQGSLLPHLTPVAHAPGSTGPQMTMASWLGPAGKGAVLITARAAAHQPPDGAQTTSGGTLWARDAVCKPSRPSPGQPHRRWPHIFICLHPPPTETVKEQVKCRQQLTIPAPKSHVDPPTYPAILWLLTNQGSLGPNPSS